MTKSKLKGLCFVLAPISKPGSNTRKRSDKVLKKIIGPVATKWGLVAKRADGMLESGDLVYPQIVGFIAQADMIIADLTEVNRNVLLELGHAYATKKNVILLMQVNRSKDKIPSDLVGQFITFYDLKSEKTIEAAQEELAKQIGLKWKKR